MIAAPESVHSEHELEHGHQQSAPQSETAANGTVPRSLLSAAGADGTQSSNSRLISTPVMLHRSAGEMRSLVLRRMQQGLGNYKTQQLVAQLRRSSLVQRQCSCGDTCETCQSKSSQEDEESRVVQRQSATAGGAPASADAAADSTPSGTAVGPDGGAVPSQVIPSDSSAQPLDHATRSFMESRFGTDFSDVRVHSNARAAESADALQADAYTSGRDIYFASGKYAPDSSEGRHLLAHELTHTVQQQNGATPMASSRAGGVLVGDAADPLEAEAEHTADSVNAAYERPPKVSLDTAPPVRRDLRSGAAAVWSATGGRVIRGVEALVDDSIGAVRGWLESHAPGLMSFVRNPVEILKERIGNALEGTLGGIFSRIRQEGFFNALSSLVAEGREALAGLLHSVAADPCGALRTLVEGFIGFQKWLGSGIWSAIQKGASAVAEFFSWIWNDLAKPAWEAIKKFAGSVWAWIEARANEFWEWIAPLRRGIAAVWHKVHQIIGAAWDKGSDIYDWLKQKAAVAWDRIKAEIQPILGPLKIIGAVLLLFSPLGPIFVAGAAAYGIFQAARWLYNNWNNLEIVIKAKKILHDQIIPWINSAVATVSSAFHNAVKWLQEKAHAISTALTQLAEALGVNAFLRSAKAAIDFVRAKVNQFMDWVSSGLRELADKIAPILTKLRNFFQPIGVVLAKLLIAIANPIFLPIYLGAVIWMILPDCIKPPIIDYILDLMIGAIRAIPNWGFFGEEWPTIKENITKPLQEKREKAPVEEKIEFSNRVANLIAGPDLTGFSNLFQAARQFPEHFTGEVERELIGMDLSEPLPLERRPATGEALLAHQAAAGLDAGGISPENAALLQKSVFADGDVQADYVPEVTMPPEFYDSLELGSDGTQVFGENPNPTITNESLRAELAGLVPSQPSPAGPGAAPQEQSGRPPADLPIEDQIRWFVSHQPPTGCQPSPEPQASGRSQIKTTSPAMQIFPPLTQSQRALFVWEQMKRGLSQWYECHKTAVIASLIGALVLLVILAVLTDGVILEVLPEILEVIGAIFIGVSIVRMSMFLADYVAKAVAGDIVGAAKSLARGIAIGAIELLMYLLTAGSGKGAAKAGERAAQEGLEAAAQAGRRVRRPFMEAAADAGRRFLVNIKNPIGAFMRNGKAFIKGLEETVARGASSLRTLGERVLERLGFRRLGVELHATLLYIYGYFNSRMLLLRINIMLALEAEERAARVHGYLGRTGRLGTSSVAALPGPRNLIAVSKFGRSASELLELAERNSRLATLISGAHATQAVVAETERITSAIASRVGRAPEDILREIGAVTERLPLESLSSHAERQIAVVANLERAIGSSRIVCENCRLFFSALARERGRGLVIADPKFIWIFLADGRYAPVSRALPVLAQGSPTLEQVRDLYRTIAWEPPVIP